MKQFDQDTAAYRVQRPDGSWTQRVDKKLCRVMAIVMGVFMAWLLVAMFQEGANLLPAIGFGVFGFITGGLLTLSFRSID